MLNSADCARAHGWKRVDVQDVGKQRQDQYGTQPQTNARRTRGDRIRCRTESTMIVVDSRHLSQTSGNPCPTV